MKRTVTGLSKQEGHIYGCHPPALSIGDLNFWRSRLAADEIMICKVIKLWNLALRLKKKHCSKTQICLYWPEDYNHKYDLLSQRCLYTLSILQRIIFYLGDHSSLCSVDKGIDLYLLNLRITKWDKLIEKYEDVRSRGRKGDMAVLNFFDLNFCNHIKMIKWSTKVRIFIFVIKLSYNLNKILIFYTLHFTKNYFLIRLTLGCIKWIKNGQILIFNPKFNAQTLTGSIWK